MRTFQEAFSAASPRLTPSPTPLRSFVIYGAVSVLWLALFARAFVIDGVFAWSTGIIYIAYDTVLLLFVFGQTLALARARGVQRAGTGVPGVRDEPVTLAVMIAARNEAGALPLTIPALLRQAEHPDEILIVDDGSDDGTAQVFRDLWGTAAPAVGGIVRSRIGGVDVGWLRLPRSGKARALNAGLAHLSSDVVVTLDADTLLDPGALAAMRAAFSAEPGLVAATGILMPVCGGGVSGRLLQLFQTYEYIRNFLSRYAWMQLDSLLLISGAFAGYRREAVLAVGGFDPECLVEDYELIHRLRRYGVRAGLAWHTRVIGSALAHTDAPSTVAAFLGQRRRWFGGFLQTQYWYREMVGNGRYGWLGTVMLPVKALDTLQPFYGLMAAALLVFYVVSGRFALALPVGGIVLAKIALDLGFHLWSVHLFRRWTGQRRDVGFGWAVAAALAEPFSFQLLRHGGAALGWVAFLTGQRAWGSQSRLGIVPEGFDGPARADPDPGFVGAVPRSETRPGPDARVGPVPVR